LRLWAATAAVLLAACNPVTGTGQGTPPDPAQFLHVDPGASSAVLTLVAAYPVTDYQFNYDGYRSGELLLRIPSGWSLTVQCQNRGTVSNSCSVVRDGRASEPLQPGWTTPDPQAGLAPGASAGFTFTTPEPGRYRIASLTQGHESSGMWMALEVTAGGAPKLTVGGG